MAENFPPFYHRIILNNEIMEVKEERKLKDLCRRYEEIVYVNAACNNNVYYPVLCLYSFIM